MGNRYGDLFQKEGVILRKVFFAQVEGEVATLDEAKTLGAKLAKEMGLI